MKAELLIRERVVFPERDMVEMVVWRLPEPVAPTTHGFKYRLVYVVDGKRVLGCDNERGKGDHRHEADVEALIAFQGIDELLDRFATEVEIRRSKP